MGDFGIFYQNGGFFMNFITVAGAVALAAVLLHARSRRMGHANDELLRVADRVAGVGVAIGLIGTLFGCIDLGAALNMADPSKIDAVKLMQAGARGFGIAVIPLAWGLMCAVPIWLLTVRPGRAVQRAAA
jgi:hypothetical protein